MPELSPEDAAPLLGAFVGFTIGSRERPSSRRPEPKLPLMGVAEVASLLGVPKWAVRRWWREGRMPDPLAELESGPVWNRKQINECMETWEEDPRERLGRRD